MDEFRPSESGAIRAEFKRLYHLALQQGRGQKFMAAFKTIRAHMISDPEEFGEPTFDLPHMKLVNYVAIVAPISVEYCVDKVRKIVYLRRIRLLDEH